MVYQNNSSELLLTVLNRNILCGRDEYDAYMKQINKDIPGIWYGIWERGTYWIAKNEMEAVPANTLPYEIASGTYAVFSTDCGGFAEMNYQNSEN